MNKLIYLNRCIFHNVPRITDYRYFPFATIKKGPATTSFIPAPDIWQPPTIEYQFKQQPLSAELIPLLDQTGTTACIVMQQNQILFEHYANGYTKDSINTSFSVAKSMVAVLVGIALDEGLITSIEDPIGKYLPHFQHGSITIGHLLTMSSGLSYQEGVTPWSDDAKVYYGLNLREQALKAKVIESPGTTYHYNNYNLLLLGLILEKVTGVPVPQYFQEKIWQYIGAEADASWSLDSKTSGFAKMESGFNARAMDFVRFGALCLQGGKMNGRQIVSTDWLHEAVCPPATKPDSKKYLGVLNPPLSRWTASNHGYYKYLWWGWKIDDSTFDYFALGAKGQFIYICPRTQAVIVRFGKKWGSVDWWPAILKQIGDSLGINSKPTD
ncbi:serine hydrolase domain-containing protein [Chitinophaga silvatica]|nr:serine hydrolase [Chitinophaga silvatica]